MVSDLGRIDIDEGALEPHGSRPWSFSGVNLNPVKTDGTLVIQESTVTGVAGEEMWIELKDNLVADIGAAKRRVNPSSSPQAATTSATPIWSPVPTSCERTQALARDFVIQLCHRARLGYPVRNGDSSSKTGSGGGTRTHNLAVNSLKGRVPDRPRASF